MAYNYNNGVCSGLHCLLYYGPTLDPRKFLSKFEQQAMDTSLNLVLVSTIHIIQCLLAVHLSYSPNVQVGTYNVTTAVAIKRELTAL